MPAPPKGELFGAAGKFAAIAKSRPLGEGGLTRSGKTEGVLPGVRPLSPFPVHTPSGANAPAPPRGRLNPLSHGLRRASSPEGGAFAVTAKLPAKPQSVRLRKKRPLRRSRASSPKGGAKPFGSLLKF